ncbi:hypothetical protein ABGB18_11330 [Nonomuraea sp. B12E4]
MIMPTPSRRDDGDDEDDSRGCLALACLLALISVGFAIYAVINLVGLFAP